MASSPYEPYYRALISHSTSPFYGMDPRGDLRGVDVEKARKFLEAKGPFTLENMAERFDKMSKETLYTFTVILLADWMASSASSSAGRPIPNSLPPVDYLKSQIPYFVQSNSDVIVSKVLERFKLHPALSNFQLVPYDETRSRPRVGVYFMRHSSRWETVSFAKDEFALAKKKCDRMVIVACVPGHSDNWTHNPPLSFEGTPIVQYFLPSFPPFSERTLKDNLEASEKLGRALA